jgi:tetratricopeptide (TPR) repeat protein
MRAYALALQWSSRESEALEMFDRVLSSCTVALSDKGVFLNQLGRFDEAQELFDRAITNEPHLATAWYNKSTRSRYHEMILIGLPLKNCRLNIAAIAIACSWSWR